MNHQQGFSSALKLTDLNDFIQPSQVCIKPAEALRQDDDDGAIKINRKKNWKHGSQSGDEKPEPSVPAPVNVTLGDCLACSGCITSAEAVLIEAQSHEKILQVLEERKKSPENLLKIFLTLSLQSLASIGARFGLSIQDTAEHLAYFFHDLGVDYIMDISLARHICLVESHREFLERTDNRPVLSSTCPGFVCYAEKSQGPILVPLLSRIKSPQQIMGVLIKERSSLIDPEIVKNKTKIYHITLMPCYDKKLEASRNDNKIDQEPEVDCVITPVELEKILEFKQIKNLEQLPRRKLDQFCQAYSPDCRIYSHPGSGSGGYAENLLRSRGVSSLSDWKTIRNQDFLEKIATNENGEKISVAILNGFRNVQNLVSRIKRNGCNYDYIEVSACPKGCLNGGAQLRDSGAAPGSDAARSAFEQAQRLYDELPKTEFSVSEPPGILYEKLAVDESLRARFRTEFHALEKKFNILNSNW